MGVSRFFLFGCFFTPHYPFLHFLHVFYCLKRSQRQKNGSLKKPSQNKIHNLLLSTAKTALILKTLTLLYLKFYSVVVGFLSLSWSVCDFLHWWPVRMGNICGKHDGFLIRPCAACQPTTRRWRRAFHHRGSFSSAAWKMFG